MTNDAPILEARAVRRVYPGVVALDGVDLEVRPGEVLAVIGENGAGKSTLMKILAGLETPSDGELHVDGAVVRLGSAADATERGIALIHQELNLAGNLSVAANVWLGREPRRAGFVRNDEINTTAAALLERVGLDVAPTTPTDDLAIGQQQLVEIAKALSFDARVVIMDEPTSSLSHRECERLFEVVRDLRSRGVAIVYISHRLGEVTELADRVVVLRDGRRVGELVGDEISRDTMVSLMVGRDLEPPTPRNLEDSAAAVRLAVRGVRTRAHPSHTVDLDVARGEIVGIAGLVGAGRTELVETIFGIVPALEGAIEIDGARVDVGRPRDAIEHGLALVPEDRRRHGLVVDMTVRENLVLAIIHRLAKLGLRRPRAEAAVSSQRVGGLGIRAASDNQAARFLSGGNQQKVVIGRWLETQPRVLLMDEPTRGIDVGAKQEIYTLIRSLADEGLSILFVSSELDEVLQLADRIAVMHEGEVVGTMAASDATEERIMLMATGSVAA